MPYAIAKSKSPQDALRRFKANVFSVLANPTRIHIIECLRRGECSVSQLIEQLGVEPANASQHLAILRSKMLVRTRKEGNQVFYSLRDQALGDVLDSMRKLYDAHVSETKSMLDSLTEGVQR